MIILACYKWQIILSFNLRRLITQCPLNCRFDGKEVIKMEICIPISTQFSDWYYFAMIIQNIACIVLAMIVQTKFLSEKDKQ
jgi:hypothetical protein